jgi:hypothetical protein
MSSRREDLGSRARTALWSPDAGHPWVLVQIRPWDRLRAAWQALRLDAELAAGEPAATSRLRAVRASMLVAPRLRHDLAVGWRRCLHSDPPSRLALPVQRACVLAAAPEIDNLADALQAPRPVAARGVARAALLLTDATGPLYNVHSRLDLTDELRLALHHLQPSGAHTP